MNTLKTMGWVALAVLIILYSSIFTVNQGHKAMLLRLGEIVNDAQGKPLIIEPGLHFKTPLIVKVRKFDTRLQTLTAQSSRILTEDQKYVLVDYYIKWRIDDLSLYYQRTSGDVLQAQTLLQQQVNDALRSSFGQRTLTEMVSGERVNIMSLLKDSANATAQNLGIWVEDVRIKSIDFPKELSEKVFSTMRTGREQVAAQYRADGSAMAEAIKAEADAKAAILIAQSKGQAAALRAQGDAEAAAVYNSAYGQDYRFYTFYRSLEAYRTVFNANKQNILVLTPHSEFLKYFNPGEAVSKMIAEMKGDPSKVATVASTVTPAPAAASVAAPTPAAPVAPVVAPVPAAPAAPVAAPVPGAPTPPVSSPASAPAPAATKPPAKSGQ